MWNWLKRAWRRFLAWDYIDNGYRRQDHWNVDYNDNPSDQGQSPSPQDTAATREFAVAGSMLYPVDLNARWAFYRISTGEVLRHNVRWPRADGGEIVGLDPDIVPLREVADVRPVPAFDPEQPTAPVYDPATQTYESGPSVVDTVNNTHTHTWVIRDLTQEELDQNAAEEASNTERDQAKVVYADLKNGVGTSTERLVRLEKVAAHLLKVQYGDVA